ncbi:unnamed protein product [Hymenolepis diminuta]|uniref:Uncharacterized protein n=1 Tax=Hymenolepis diminuta TaxID=6216 RepID=A0A564ZCY6_HYMDI|nr:unnamed protein product [Hymenolepis diminuta]
MNQFFTFNQQLGTTAPQTDMGMGNGRLKKCTRKNALKHVIQRSGESEAEKIVMRMLTTQAYFNCHQTRILQCLSGENYLEVHEVPASKAKTRFSDSSISGVGEMY